MQTQITCQCVIEEETEKLSKKPLHCSPSGNRSTRQSVKKHGLARDPPSLIYPLYLSLPSSYSNKASRNRVLSSIPDPATSSMFICHPWLLPILPSIWLSTQIIFEHVQPYKWNKHSLNIKLVCCVCGSSVE